MIETFVPTSFLKMWFWERFPASRSGVNTLSIRSEGVVSTSGRARPIPQIRHPRTALYEKQYIKKKNGDFMWIVDNLQSFRARLYDDVPRSDLFIGPSFLFFGDTLDSKDSKLDDEE